MRRSIVAAVAAASITGGATALVFGPTAIVGAAEDVAAAAAEPAGWVAEALSGLVEDETLTQEQADAVQEALEEARPRRGPGVGRHLRGEGVVADALGVTPEELHEALADGSTIAEVAESEGVDVQVVIDAVVADMSEHLADAVEDGRLTQEEADERLEGAEERATALVNGERPEGGPGHGPGRGGPGWRHGPRGGR